MADGRAPWAPRPPSFPPATHDAKLNRNMVRLHNALILLLSLLLSRSNDTMVKRWVLRDEAHDVSRNEGVAGSSGVDDIDIAKSILVSMPEKSLNIISLMLLPKD